MLVAERQRKIVELVNERASVRVTELSSLFHVTEETIRRDLEKLERSSCSIAVMAELCGSKKGQRRLRMKHAK